METSTLARDTATQALLNTDVAGLQAYKSRRQKSEKLLDLERDINTIKTQIREIHELVKNILAPR